MCRPTGEEHEENLPRAQNAEDCATRVEVPGWKESDVRVTFRPLVWAGPRTPAARRRTRDAFTAPWHDTVDLLDRELRHLGVEEFVIAADFTASDICPDGMPRAGAGEPVFPGVRIEFTSRHGPLVLQTDTCDFWQHNVSSIALGLATLRAVDRYGITSRAEQYSGFGVPDPCPAAPAEGPRRFPDVLSALRWVRDPDVCGVRGAEGAALKSVLRLVARQTHPDRGGTRAQWDSYQEARRVLAEAGMI